MWRISQGRAVLTRPALVSRNLQKQIKVGITEEFLSKFALLNIAKTKILYMTTIKNNTYREFANNLQKTVSPYYISP